MMIYVLIFSLGVLCSAFASAIIIKDLERQIEKLHILSPFWQEWRDKQ